MNRLAKPSGRFGVSRQKPGLRSQERQHFSEIHTFSDRISQKNSKARALRSRFGGQKTQKPVAEGAGRFGVSHKTLALRSPRQNKPSALWALRSGLGGKKPRNPAPW